MWRSVQYFMLSVSINKFGLGKLHAWESGHCLSVWRNLDIMALSKGFRIFEKKQPNHSILLEHRNRSHEGLLFESQAIAVLCKQYIINLSISKQQQQKTASFILVTSIDTYTRWPVIQTFLCVKSIISVIRVYGGAIEFDMTTAIIWTLFCRRIYALLKCHSK